MLGWRMECGRPCLAHIKIRPPQASLHRESAACKGEGGGGREEGGGRREGEEESRKGRCDYRWAREKRENKDIPRSRRGGKEDSVLDGAKGGNGLLEIT